MNLLSRSVIELEQKWQEAFTETTFEGLKYPVESTDEVSYRYISAMKCETEWIKHVTRECIKDAAASTSVTLKKVFKFFQRESISTRETFREIRHYWSHQSVIYQREKCHPTAPEISVAYLRVEMYLLLDELLGHLKKNVHELTNPLPMRVDVNTDQSASFRINRSTSFKIVWSPACVSLIY